MATVTQYVANIVILCTCTGHEGDKYNPIYDILYSSINMSM